MSAHTNTGSPLTTLFYRRNNPAEYSKRNTKLNKYWDAVKNIETGLENPLQTLIMLWLLQSKYQEISEMSWEHLVLSTLRGLLPIITLGFCDIESEVEKQLGKLLFACFNIAISSALIKLDKPGMTKCDKFAKGLPVLLLSSALQVVAKIYAMKALIAIEYEGAPKYATYYVIQVVFLTFINYLTDSSSIQENRKLSNVKKVLNIFCKLISSMLSGFVKIDFKYDSVNHSNYKLTSTAGYQIFQLVSNSACIMINYSISKHSGKEFQNWFLWIFLPWILSNSIEVNS